MVGRVSPSLQESLLKLLLDVSEGRGDQAAERAAQIGQRLENFDRVELERRVSEIVGLYRHATLGQMQIGRVLLDLSRAAGDTGLRLPSELTMLAKTLLQLDEVGRALDPEFDPNAAIRENTAELLRRRMLQSASPGNIAAGLLEAKEFVEKLPGRVNKVLDGLANNQLSFRVDAIDEDVADRGPPEDREPDRDGPRARRADRGSGSADAGARRTSGSSATRASPCSSSWSRRPEARA